MPDNCASCFFYRAPGCHRAPPVFIEGAGARWPDVAASHWCGEWSTSGAIYIGGPAGPAGPKGDAGAGIVILTDVAADLGTISDTSGGGGALSVPGALATDAALVICPAGLPGGVAIGNARPAANAVTVAFNNTTGFPVALGLRTYRVAVFRP